MRRFAAWRGAARWAVPAAASAAALLAVMLFALAARGKAPAPNGLPVPTPASASPSPSATPSASPNAAEAACSIGQFQYAVEAALAKLGGYGPVSVDGRQSDEDCTAIKTFQTRFGLVPVDGIAGMETAGVAERLASTDTTECDAAARGTTACVDLTHQTTWLMRGGEVVYGPTVVRTGMAGHVTPTGSYTIDYKALKDWSKPYHVWLPYWQSFNNDIGFHETTTYIHNPDIGSHGCVNLLPEDAVGYWDSLSEGSSVRVFGNRPGT
jgi:hypothetical protein